MDFNYILLNHPRDRSAYNVNSLYKGWNFLESLTHLSNRRFSFFQVSPFVTQLLSLSVLCSTALHCFQN